MPFLNYNYHFLVYEDEQSSNNPNIKIPDVSITIDGIPVNNSKSDSGSVYPNQIKDISVSSRPLLWDTTTELSFVRHLASTGSSASRLYYTGTGTAPLFRTNRNMGGAADTVVEITRISEYIARISNIGGTPWNLTNVEINDYLKFDIENDLFSTPFSTTNQGKEFLVVAKGTDYIDFVDNSEAAEETNLTLGANYDKVLKVLSQGPVVTGDIFQVNSTSLNPSNKGKFEITNVSDDFIEYVNPLTIAETFLYTTGSVVIYEFLIGFLHLRATGPFKIRFDDQQEWISVAMLGQYATFIGSVSTHKTQILNDSPQPISFSVQTARVC